MGMVAVIHRCRVGADKQSARQDPVRLHGGTQVGLALLVDGFELFQAWESTRLPERLSTKMFWLFSVGNGAKVKKEK